MSYPDAAAVFYYLSMHKFVHNFVLWEKNTLIAIVK